VDPLDPAEPPPPPPAQPERIANPKIEIYILNMLKGSIMIKLNTYSFNKINLILVFLLLFGCGNTLIKPANAIEIFNGNSVNQVSREFKLTKLKDRVSFDQLPKELASYQTQMGQFDFYLAQSPTQSSGGFVFQVVQNSDPLVICLKKPDPLSSVTAALTNPIAIVKVPKGLSMTTILGYCIR
jgi:hypothetical protein